MQALKQVKEFMETMGQDVLEYPTIPSEKIITLRHNLISEENDEMVVAAADHDLVEVGDALTDSLVVLMGAFHAYGFGEILQPMMDEVQRSNMSKACATQEEAQETVDHYNTLDTDNETVANNYDISRVGEWFIVKRTKDGKIMKSINYSPANLRPIIESREALKPKK